MQARKPGAITVTKWSGFVALLHDKGKTPFSEYGHL